MLRSRARAAALLVFVFVLAVFTGAAGTSATGAAQAAGEDSVIFFTADGMRQDLAQYYAANKAMPTIAKLLKTGAKAGDEGLLTQAPPNTGAGWYSLATGAWPGVHGSTNNTFSHQRSAVRESHGAFDAGVLQAETIAQSAERGGKKVAQIEWAGGRVGVINGPTVDFRDVLLRPRRGDELHQPDRQRGLHGLVRPPVRPPGGLRRAAGVPAAAPTRRDRLDRALPQSFSPAKEMRLRVLDFGTDKYGLNAYIFDSTNDGERQLRPRAVLADEERRGQRRDPAQGQWADVKVADRRRRARREDRRAARQGREADRGTSRKVRLFHTSVSRANATLAGLARESGFTGDFEEYVAQKFPTSPAGRLRGPRVRHRQRGDLHRAGPVLGDRHPPADQVHPREVQARPRADRLSDDRRDPAPVPRAGHPKLPNGAPNPAYDDVEVNGTPDERVAQRTAFVRRARTRARTTTLRLVAAAHADRRRRRSSPRTTASRRSSRAIDASKVLVDLGPALEAADVELPAGATR